MPQLKRHSPSYLDIIGTARETRVAAGLTCPHCGSHRVVRWGSFSGRQRYRCRTCRRTFSDLTMTPFAYSKKISKWPHYLSLMRGSRTLRSASRLLDIHVSTAFRWRHALLKAMRAQDDTTLGGTIEIREMLFAHSMKGSRRVVVPRQRGARTAGWKWHEVGHDRVLLAYARTGPVHSQTVGGDVIVVHEVLGWARLRLEAHCTVLGRLPSAGACGSAVRSAGHDYRMIRANTIVDPLSVHHTQNVDAYGMRLLEWLHRFRGIASKYRDNYLVWHRRADADLDLLWARSIVVCTMPGEDIRGTRALRRDIDVNRRSCPTTDLARQQFPRTQRERRAGPPSPESSDTDPPTQDRSHRDM